MEENSQGRAIRIKVVGVGGGGCNAVSNMYGKISDEIKCYAFNTDAQSLENCNCENTLLLGKNITNGFGAGMNYEKGREAAEDTYDEIKKSLSDADLVFIAAGEGGGTGTGACPVVARACKENGSLVIAIVTRPFNFEGINRANNATEGLKRLKDIVDSYIVISNDKLMFEAGNVPIGEMFKQADAILCTSVKMISDIILKNGLINLDFADVETILKGKGLTLIGFGNGKGKNRAIDAATSAIESPFLEASIKGANSFLIQITASKDITINEINTAIEYVSSIARGEAKRLVNLIFGATIDETLDDSVQITIIATDLDKDIDLQQIYDDKFREKTEIKTHDVKTEQISENQNEKTVEINKEDEEKKDEKQNESILPSFLRNIFNNK